MNVKTFQAHERLISYTRDTLAHFLSNLFINATFVTLTSLRDKLQPLGDGLAATKPMVLDAFHVLAIEANLDHFF